MNVDVEEELVVLIMRSKDSTVEPLNNGHIRGRNLVLH